MSHSRTHDRALNRVTIASPPSTRRSRWAIPVVLAAIPISFFIACVIAPALVAPGDPTRMDQRAVLQPPGLSHLLGTDHFGRDLFALIVHGAGPSLSVAIVAVIVGGLGGAVIGGVAGHFGGFLDTVLMRMVDVVLTIPGILLALAIAASLGPGFANIVIAIAIGSIPGYARVLRGQVLTVGQRPFVSAATALGSGRARTLVQHVLPHAWSPLAVMLTLGFGSAILAVSALSFLGLGPDTATPDWGTLLAQGRDYITVAWWMTTFPGLVITIFVLAVNVLGDQLRDIVDPLSTPRRGGSADE